MSEDEKMELILWSADWCRPCGILKEWLKGKRVSVEIQHRNPEDYPAAAIASKVRGLPTLEIIWESGVTPQVVGAPEIRQVIEGWVE